MSEQPQDFVPGPGWVDEHSVADVGGPGGVVNYPPESWPEGFDPDADYASPKVG